MNKLQFVTRLLFSVAILFTSLGGHAAAVVGQQVIVELGTETPGGFSSFIWATFTVGENESGGTHQLLSNRSGNYYGSGLVDVTNNGIIISQINSSFVNRRDYYYHISFADPAVRSTTPFPEMELYFSNINLPQGAGYGYFLDPTNTYLYRGMSILMPQQLVTDGTIVLQFLDATSPPAEVPAPAAAWLMGSGLLGLLGAARRKAAV
jgi:hypothetical protein